MSLTRRKVRTFSHQAALLENQLHVVALEADTISVFLRFQFLSCFINLMAKVKSCDPEPCCYSQSPKLLWYLEGWVFRSFVTAHMVSSFSFSSMNMDVIVAVAATFTPASAAHIQAATFNEKTMQTHIWGFRFQNFHVHASLCKL